MVSNTSGLVEAPVVFGRDRSLIGSTCTPSRPSPARPFVLFINSGIIHRIGPNRIYVRIARALAAHGFSSLRFDLSGIGDSVLPPGAKGMSIQERVELDIDDAVAFAHERLGATRFVVIGLCSGADNALRTMARREDVVGAVLLDLNTHLTRGFWIRHYARRLLRLRPWLNVVTGRHPYVRRVLARIRRPLGSAREDPASDMDAPTLNLDAWIPRDLMRTYLERIVARGGRLLCVFTAGLPMQYNYREQLLDVVDGLDFRGLLTLEYYADSDHTFSRTDLQARLTTAILGWMNEIQVEVEVEV